MKDKDRIILQKIISYANDTLMYTENMSFDLFMKDRKTISACAFSIGQIGELVKEVDSITQENNPQIPWKSIRGMRNRIIHNYDNVDLAVLWGTIRKSLPELVSEINNILAAET